ncbi:MAG: transglycosylase domain-containing protein [Eubacteriales bacterium]
MPARNRPPQKRGDTDWGNEVAGAVGIVGTVFGKCVSYIFNILLTILLIGIITGAVVGGAFAIYVKNYVNADLDSFDLLATGQSMTTKIYYMDYTDRENRIGTPVEIEDQRLYGSENRMWASYSDMPTYLVEAFVSIEDHRFWDHKGVDWFTTLKATFGYFTGTSSAGGSTITQQLIKNVTGEDKVSIQRKVQEILRALELEKTKDKTEIIELYLNTIFLSQRSYGVAAAAYTYFNKSVKDLTLIECAALASIPQYPTAYDPAQKPENNLERRNAVLDRMLELGKITKTEYDSAYNKELKLNMPSDTMETATNSWYTDQVIEETITLLMNNLSVTREVASRMIYNSGLSIYIVMDPEVQSVLEEVYKDETSFPSANGIIQPESSCVIIDPATGDIVGLVGGRGEKTKNRIFNYATQAKRPPGSSIKPLTVYGPALEYGLITYGSVFDDIPINFGDKETDSSGNTYYTRSDGWPQNYPKIFNGLTTVNDAITRSVNTISLRVLQKLTVERSFDFAYNKLNLSLVESRELTGGKVVTDKDLAPLGLGELSYGLSVSEMTAAYAAYDNNGIYNSPRTVIKILDSEGNVIIDNDTSGKVVVSEQTASILTKMLQNVVSSGTAKRITLQNTINCAGKTGTTSNDNDRWFVGYTPYYVGGVWFGYEMPKSLNAFTISPCVTVWDTIMTKLHEKFINAASEGSAALKTFTLADGVVTKTYCKDSGKLITDACRADPRGSRAEVGYFTNATAPTESCDVHVLVDYDKNTGAVADVDCPEESVVKVGLLHIMDRSFPVQITVTDAQYVYREISEDDKICTDSNNAFFAYSLPEGTYAGLSAADSQYNRYCSKHYDPDKPEETTTAETEPPEGDIEPIPDPGIDEY